jgi:hypothetical protein
MKGDQAERDGSERRGSRRGHESQLGFFELTSNSPDQGPRKRKEIKEIELEDNMIDDDCK